jgi:hypothetical protein
MATINCKDFPIYLEPWMEGQRHPDAQAHVRDCPRCRSLVEDLNFIQASAQEWGAAEVEPPAQLWASLRAQLVEEGLIREEQFAPDAHSSRVGSWFNGLPRLGLATAYLAALIAVAFALSGPVNERINRQRWLAGMQSSTTPVRAHLAKAEQNTNLSSLPDSNPIVTASLQDSLAIVDNHIALCEKSVSEEPENELARDFLYDAYQQKADLLAQLSDRGGYGR